MKNFYKKKEDSKIYWVQQDPNVLGIFEFTFDKVKIYNLFRDYPEKLSAEEKKIFDKENPEWANFFAGNLNHNISKNVAEGGKNEH